MNVLFVILIFVVLVMCVQPPRERFMELYKKETELLEGLFKRANLLQTESPPGVPVAMDTQQYRKALEVYLSNALNNNADYTATQVSRIYNVTASGDTFTMNADIINSRLAFSRKLFVNVRDGNVIFVRTDDPLLTMTFDPAEKVSRSLEIRNRLNWI
ncbi:hypothetical protein EBZ38_02380 [bacterium]|nr:hypothetical protein [bacterium]NDC93785.1 hypothetical protein [bacterium]NDD83118.1 hypothetical protein [bacterium]